MEAEPLTAANLPPAGPAALMAAASRDVEDANRKRNTAFWLGIFQSICATLIMGLLGWACSYISDIKSKDQERDTTQKLFAQKMESNFAAAEAKRSSFEAVILGRFASIEKSQEDARQHAEKMDERVVALEGQLREISTILRVKGITLDAPVPAQKRP